MFLRCFARPCLRFTNARTRDTEAGKVEVTKRGKEEGKKEKKRETTKKNFSISIQLNDTFLLFLLLMMEFLKRIPPESVPLRSIPCCSKPFETLLGSLRSYRLICHSSSPSSPPPPPSSSAFSPFSSREHRTHAFLFLPSVAIRSRLRARCQ